MTTRAQQLMAAAGNDIDAAVAKVKAAMEADLPRQLKYVSGGPSFSSGNLRQMAGDYNWDNNCKRALKAALEADGWEVTIEHPKDSNTRGMSYWKLRAK